jgi:hypothetical protein
MLTVTLPDGTLARVADVHVHRIACEYVTEYPSATSAGEACSDAAVVMVGDMPMCDAHADDFAREADGLLDY